MRFMSAVCVCAAMGCGTDAFGGGDGEPPDAGEASTLDVAHETGVADTGWRSDVSVADAIDEQDKDVAPACTDPCATCVESACLLSVICVADTTCASEITTFESCRCGGKGSTCNPPIANSSDTLVDLTFANCAKSNCPVCGF